MLPASGSPGSSHLLFSQVIWFLLIPSLIQQTTIPNTYPKDIFNLYLLGLAPRLTTDLACAFLTRASNHPIDYSAEQCRIKRDQEAFVDCSPLHRFTSGLLLDQSFLTYPGISEITFFLRNIDYE